MTTTVAALIGTKAVETAETKQYPTTPDAVRTIIDKFDVYNGTNAAITFTVRIVPSGGTAGVTNALLSKSIGAGETYRCPEIVGHTMESGDFISTLAGATGLTMRASGRKVTI